MFETLSCLNLLYSYPCNNDDDCFESGMTCCQTKCIYGKRMCVPRGRIQHYKNENMHNPGINSWVYLFCLFVFSLFHSLILFKCSFITPSQLYGGQSKLSQPKFFVFIRKYQERCVLRRQFLFSFLHSVYKQTLRRLKQDIIPILRFTATEFPLQIKGSIYMCRFHSDIGIPIPNDR